MLQAPSSRNHPSSLPFSSGSTLSSQLVLFVTFFSSLFSFLAPHRIIIVTGIQEDNESPSGRLEAGSRNVQTKKLTFRYLHTVPASSSVQFFFFFLFFSLSLFPLHPLISRRTVQKRKHRDCFTLQIYIELLSFVPLFFPVMFLVEG